jgi:hypothetical protein
MMKKLWYSSISFAGLELWQRSAVGPSRAGSIVKHFLRGGAVNMVEWVARRMDVGWNRAARQ